MVFLIASCHDAQRAQIVAIERAYHRKTCKIEYLVAEEGGKDACLTKHDG